MPDKPERRWKQFFSDDELKQIKNKFGKDDTPTATAQPQPQQNGLPDIMAISRSGSAMRQQQPAEPEWEGWGRQLGKGMRIGWDGVRLGFHGTRAMNIEDEDKRNEYIRERIRPIQKRMHAEGYAPTSMEFHKIGSMRDAAEWIVGQTGALTPIVGSIMAASMTGGVAGAKSGAAIGTKVGAAGGPKGAAAGAALGTKIGTFTGSTIAGFLQGYNLYAGGMYGDLLEMGVEHDLAKQTAQKYAVPASAVSLVVPSAVTSAVILGLPKQYIRARAKSMMIGAGLGVVTEGTAEAMAETFVIMGEEFALGERYPDEVRNMRILDAGAAGGLAMGGPMGAVGGRSLAHVSLEQVIDNYIDVNTEISDQVQRPVIWNYLVEQLETRKKEKGLMPEEQTMLEYLTQNKDKLKQRDNRTITKIVNENDKVLLDVWKRDDQENTKRLEDLLNRDLADPGSLSLAEQTELTGIMVNKPAIVQDVLGHDAFEDARGPKGKKGEQTGDTDAGATTLAEGSEVDYLDPADGLPKKGKLIGIQDGTATIESADGKPVIIDESDVLRRKEQPAGEQPAGDKPAEGVQRVTYQDGKAQRSLDMQQAGEGVWESDVSSQTEKQTKSALESLKKKYKNLEFTLEERIDESQPFAEAQQVIVARQKARPDTKGQEGSPDQRRAEIEEQRRDKRGQALEEIGIEKFTAGSDLDGSGAEMNDYFVSARDADLSKVVTHAENRVKNNPNVALAGLPAAYDNAIRAELSIHGTKVDRKTKVSDVLAQLKEIQAKYDAELAALEGKPEGQQEGMDFDESGRPTVGTSYTATHTDGATETGVVDANLEGGQTVVKVQRDGKNAFLLVDADGKVMSDTGAKRTTETKAKPKKDPLDNYEVRSRGGNKVDVLNKKTNRPVGPRSIYYNTVVLNHFEQNYDQINSAERISDVEPSLDMGRYYQKVSKESVNPFEIAEVYLDFRAVHPEYFDPIRNTIADMLTRFPKDAFVEFGDRNQLGWNREIQMNYFAKEGGTYLDKQAQEMSTVAGLEITPQDIIEFINDFPGGRKTYYKYAEQADPLIGQLKENFLEETGVVLTDAIADGLDRIIMSRTETGQLSREARAEIDAINSIFADDMADAGWNEYYEQKRAEYQQELEQRRQEDEEIRRQAERDQEGEGTTTEPADQDGQEGGQTAPEVTTGQEGQVEPAEGTGQTAVQKGEFGGQEVTYIADYYETPGARELAHKVKDGDLGAVADMAEEMAPAFPKGAVLIPVPGATGKATLTKELVDAIAERVDGKVADVLQGDKRESLYEKKKRGEETSQDELGLKKVGEVPDGQVFLVDTVLGTGTTISAARAVIPNAEAVVHSVDKTQGADQTKWPQPNEHGVYSKAEAQVIEVTKKKVEASIHYMEIRPGVWITGRNYQSSKEGYGDPLNTDRTFTSAKEAIRAEFDRMRPEVQKLLRKAVEAELGEAIDQGAGDLSKVEKPKNWDTNPTYEDTIYYGYRLGLVDNKGRILLNRTEETPVSHQGLVAAIRNILEEGPAPDPMYFTQEQYEYFALYLGFEDKAIDRDTSILGDYAKQEGKEVAVVVWQAARGKLILEGKDPIPEWINTKDTWVRDRDGSVRDLKQDRPAIGQAIDTINKTVDAAIENSPVSGATLMSQGDTRNLRNALNTYQTIVNRYHVDLWVDRPFNMIEERLYQGNDHAKWRVTIGEGKHKGRMFTYTETPFKYKGEKPFKQTHIEVLEQTAPDTSVTAEQYRDAQISVTDGHLTQTNKKHIKEILATGLKESALESSNGVTMKVNRITYALRKSPGSDNYSVVVSQMETTTIGADPKMTHSRAKFTLKLPDGTGTETQTTKPGSKDTFAKQLESKGYAETPAGTYKIVGSQFGGHEVVFLAKVGSPHQGAYVRKREVLTKPGDGLSLNDARAFAINHAFGEKTDAAKTEAELVEEEMQRPPRDPDYAPETGVWESSLPHARTYARALGLETHWPGGHGRNILELAMLIKEKLQRMGREYVPPKDAPTDGEVALTSGVKVANLKEMYRVNRDLFGLDRVKALASAITTDRMIGTMARRDGISKEEMYGKLVFKRASEAPQGALMQEPQIFYSTAQEGLNKLNLKAGTAEQWVKMISDKGGKGTAQELSWIGLGDYLNQWMEQNNKKSVPKEVVQDYLDANKIKLVETILGEHKGLKESAEAEIMRLDSQIDEMAEDYSRQAPANIGRYWKRVVSLMHKYNVEPEFHSQVMRLIDSEPHRIARLLRTFLSDDNADSQVLAERQKDLAELDALLNEYFEYLPGTAKGQYMLEGETEFRESLLSHVPSYEREFGRQHVKKNVPSLFEQIETQRRLVGKYLGGSPQYENYVPGGKRNYREFLLKLPKKIVSKEKTKEWRDRQEQYAALSEEVHQRLAVKRNEIEAQLFELGEKVIERAEGSKEQFWYTSRGSKILTSEMLELFRTAKGIQEAMADGQMRTFMFHWLNIAEKGEASWLYDQLVKLPFNTSPANRLATDYLMRQGMLTSEELLKFTELEVERKEAGGAPTVYKHSHWGRHENVVGHARISERKTKDNKLTFFIEEMQSDWAQEGRKHGVMPDWKRPDIKWTVRRGDKVKDAFDEVVESYHTVANFLHGSEAPSITINKIDTGIHLVHVPINIPGRTEYFKRLEDAKKYAELKLIEFLYDNAFEQSTRKVPKMPYMQTAQWTGLLIRRMLKEAAQQPGIDSIGWVTGEQASEAMGLHRVVNTIQLTEKNDTNVTLELGTQGQSDDIVLFINPHTKLIWSAMQGGAERAELKGKHVSEVMGEMVYERAVNLDVGKYLHNADILVYDRGMLESYNKLVPNFFKEEARRFDKKARIEVSEVRRDDKTGSTSRQYQIPGEVEVHNSVTGESDVLLNPVIDRYGNLLRDDAMGENAHSVIMEVSNQGELSVEYRYNEPDGIAYYGTLEFGKRPGWAIPHSDTYQKNLTMPITQEMRRNLNSAVPLFQGTQGAMLAEDGNYIIYAITNPNVSTPLHEMAHVYENYLTDAEKGTVLKWAHGSQGVSWTTETSEKFARGFEKFLSEGKAPDSALQNVFDKFKKWLLDIYNGITGSDIDITLNDGMRKIYSDMLGYEVQADKPPTSPRPPVKPKPNKIFTEDAAEAARRRLRKRLGQANIGLDPQMFMDGITLAGYHIEKGARTFSAYSRAMVADLGNAVKPYLKQWYNAVYDSPEVQGTTLQSEMTNPEEVRASDIDTILEGTEQSEDATTDAFRNDLKDKLETIVRTDGRPMTMPQLKALGESFGITDAMVLREEAESVLHDIGRDVVQHNPGTRAAFNRLLEVYLKQPTFSTRSSESVEKQQYSTPLPISYLMQRFVQADKGVATFEPSAGNGLLLFAANDTNTIVNEIDGNRLKVLRGRNYHAVLDQDGSLPFTNLKGTQQAVITNPPFGSTTETSVDGYKITKLDHLMSIRALEAMADDGKAAMIIGGRTEFNDSGFLKGVDRFFFNYLYNKYNVTDVIEIPGKMYNRQGASFPVRMILVDGRKAEPEGNAPKKGDFPAPINTYEELYERAKGHIAASERQDVTPVLQSEIYVDDTGGGDVGGLDSGGQEGSGDGGLLGGTGGGLSSGAGGSGTGGGGGIRGGTGSGAGTGSGSRGGLSGSTGGTTGTKSGQSEGLGSGDLFDGPGGGTETGVGGQTGTGAGGTGTSGSSGTTGTGTTPEGTKPADRTDVNDLLKGEAHKVEYIPRSGSGTIESVMPASLAHNFNEAMDALEAEHGNIDEYVRGKLQYESLGALFDAFSGEQIDALAMAINQHDKGQAMIIGDMTGVGKGRIAAGLLWYGHLLGKKPVFVTKQAKLFSDMYRDLKDIGKEHLKPFIVNTRGKGEENIYWTDENDESVLIQRAMSADQQKPFLKSKEIDGYDLVFTTYSQFQDKKSKAKRDFMTTLAHDNLVILDESHEASGDKSNTGEFFRMPIVDNASGVVFLSATFAKRHDNMGIYAMKTGVSESELSGAALEDAVKKGGFGILEVISSNLSESGQMVRREKSYDGIVVDYKQIDNITPSEQRSRFDSVTKIVNDIIEFQNLYVNEALKDMNDQLKGGTEYGQQQGTSDAGIDNTPFVSKVFNIVEQLLFATKAEGIANEAIKLLQEDVHDADGNFKYKGKKPVIAVRNTMEAFFQDMEIKTGERISHIDFSRSMERALKMVMKVRETDELGGKTSRYLDPSELSPDGEAAYWQLMESIQSTTTGIPLSPIDIIIGKIKEAGYKVGEVTGRSFQIDLDKGMTSGTVVRREERNSTKIIKKFNSGEYDVLLLNASGATGVSAHASGTFNDKRQRVMLIGQSELDINLEVQKRGRIHRTGQVEPPQYMYVTSAIPAEQRLLMMLKTKLQSLDANTTSSQKSSGRMLEVDDMLNKYGDKVVTHYLADRQNMELNFIHLRDPLKLLGKSENEIKNGVNDAAKKAMGRVAILPVELQEKFYTEVMQEYRAYTEHLKQMEEYDLDVNVLALNAETVESRVLVEGNPSGTTAFSQPSYLEKVEVDILRKPMKRSEIDQEISNIRGDQSAEEYKQALLRRYDEEMDARKDAELKKLEERTEKRKKDAIEKANTPEEVASQHLNIARSMRESLESIGRKYDNHRLQVRKYFNSLTSGSGIRFPSEHSKGRGATVYTHGVFLGVNINENAKNPLAPSNVKFVFAIADSKRRLSIPASEATLMSSILGATLSESEYLRQDIYDNWDRYISKYDKGRQTRFMVTGDVLKGLSYLDTGRLVKYSTSDGAYKVGILLPENYDVSKEIGDQKQVRINSQDVISAIAGLSYNETFHINSDLSIRSVGHDLEFLVPNSTRKGGEFFKDPNIRDLVYNRNFVSRGQHMVGDLSMHNLQSLLDYLDSTFKIRTTIKTAEAFDAAVPEANTGAAGRPGTSGMADVSGPSATGTMPAATRDLAYATFNHTRDGHKIHVVTQEKKFSKPEDYVLKEMARKHGGWYSKYNREGAIRGFHFKSEEQAKAFMDNALDTGFVREKITPYIPGTISEMVASDTKASYGSQKNKDQALADVQEQMDMFEATQMDVFGQPEPDTRAIHQTDTEQRSSFTVPGIEEPFLRRTVQEDFREAGYVNFVGRRINSPKDLVDMLAVHRSPLIEKFHVILLDENDTVVGFSSITSNALVYVHVQNNFINQLAQKAHEHGARKVLLSHNHPSGKSQPSFEDVAITKSIENALELHYLKELSFSTEPIEAAMVAPEVEHVVINGDNYSTINLHELERYDPDLFNRLVQGKLTKSQKKQVVAVATQRHYIPQLKQAWEKGTEALPDREGRIGSSSFEHIINHMPLEENMFSVLFLDNHNAVVAFENFPADVSIKAFGDRLESVAKGQGAMRIISVSTDSAIRGENLLGIIPNHLVEVDHFYHDGEQAHSARLAGGYLRTKSGKRIFSGFEATDMRNALEREAIWNKEKASAKDMENVLWLAWDRIAEYEARTGRKVDNHTRWNIEDMSQPTFETVMMADRMNDVLRSWTNEVEAAKNIQMLPGDVAFRLAAMQEVPGAFTVDGRTYLPAFAHSSETSAWNALVSEIVAYSGISGLAENLPVGARRTGTVALNQYLNSVYADYANTTEMNHVVNRFGFDTSTDVGKRSAAELMVAMKAYRGDQIPMEGRLLSAYRIILDSLDAGSSMTFNAMTSELSDHWQRRAMAKASHGPAEFESRAGVLWDSQAEQELPTRSIREDRVTRVRGLDEYLAHTSRVETFVNDITRNWSNPDSVRYVTEIDQLPPELQAEAQKRGRIGGFWHDGVSYLLAWNLNSTEEAQQVLLHEAIGHGGVRAWVEQTVGHTNAPEALNQLYDEIYQSYRNHPEFKRVAKKYGLDMRRKEHRRIAADEYLAFLSESGDTASFVDRIVTYLRTWIRQAGFDLAITDAELRAIIQNAHRAVEGPTDGPGGGLPAPVERAAPAESPIRASILDMESDDMLSRVEFRDDYTVEPGYKRLMGLKGFFMEPLHYLEQVAGLKDVAQSVRDHYDRWAQHRGKLRGWMYSEVLKPMKKLTRKERNMVKKQYAEYQRLKETGDKALAETYLERAHELTQKMVEVTTRIGNYAGELNQTFGVMVYDPRIKAWRPIGRVADFFPRKLNKLTEMTLRNAAKHVEHWNALVDALVAEGHVETRAEADKYLKNYIQESTQTDYFAGVEKARTRALPSIAYDYSFDVMIDYAERWSERISQIENFGQETEVGTYDIFNDAINNRISDKQTREFVGALRDRVYNKNMQDGFHQTLAGLNKITTGLQLGNWGTATLNLFGGLTLNFIAYPSKATARAMMDLTGVTRFVNQLKGGEGFKAALKDLVELRALAEAIEDGIHRGALTNDMISLLRDTDNITGTITMPEWTAKIGLKDRTIDLNTAMNRFVNFTMKYGGYTPTEIFIRSHAQLSGKYFLLDALDSWNKDVTSRKSLQRIRWMEENGFDYRRLLRENGEGAYTERFIRYTSNLTQGSYRVDQVPIHVDHPIGRFIFKYVKFITQVSRMFYKNHYKPFVDTITEGGAEVRVEVDGVMTTKRVAEFHSMLRYFGMAVIGGEFVRGMRNVLFGYMFQGAELDELEKALEDDERMLMLSLLFERAFWNLQAVGALTIFGNYGQIMSDVYARERMRNPLEPPAVGMVKGVGELFIRASEQGTLTARDIDDILQGTFSLYRTTKRPALRLLDETAEHTGLEVREAEYWSATLDRNWSRKQFRRFSDETGLEGRRTSLGRIGRSENSPVNQAIYESLAVGDGIRAVAVFNKAAEDRTADELSQLRGSIQASMRSRQPLGNITDDTKARFMEWAEARLPSENVERLRHADKRYFDAYAQLNNYMRNLIARLREIDQQIERLENASDTPEHRERIRILQERRGRALKQLK